MPESCTPVVRWPFSESVFGCQFVVVLMSILSMFGQSSLVGQRPSQSPDERVSSRRDSSVVDGGMNDSPSIQSLIQQLGADEYVDRELAEVEIGKLGVAAMEPLKQACSPLSSHADSEIRLRAERLLILIHREDFRRRENRFLAAEESTLGDFGFTGWREFSEIVGTNRPSRRLFMGMYQSQENRFLAFAHGKSALEQETEMRDSSQFEFKRSSGRLLSRLCGLMFLASHQFSGVGPEQGLIKTEGRELAMICSQLCDAETLAYVRSCAHTSEIERLVDYWFTVLVAQSDVPVDLRLDVLEKYHLANQLEFLMVMVVDSNLLMENRQRAMLSLATLGDQRQVKLLQPLLDDASLVGRFPHPDLDGQGLEVQFRDLVLASCIHLVGSDPVEFGFLPSVKESDESKLPFDPTRTGFTDPSLRDRALAKWYSARDRFFD